MITNTTKRRATARALMLAGVSGLLLAVACETPAPTDAAAVDSPAAGSLKAGGVEGVLGMTDAACAAVLVDGAQSTLAEVRAMDPERIERIEVVKGGALPEAMKEEGACGLISVSTKGASAAEEGEDARARRQAEVGAPRDGAPAESGDVAAGPTFTPMTVAPRLRNASETSARLQELYPPLLRDAGIGGTTNVWFFIDETGRVTKTQVNRSSGHDALDQAALAVAREMEFEPALNRDERVAVWVALDITFEVE